MRLRLASLICVCSLATTACAGGVREPAPIQRGVQSTPECADGVTVRRGDTLYAIARRCEVDVNALADANRLTSAATISPGQRLSMPRPPVYTVRRGDNLYRIALAHGMTTQQLAELNGLRAPYTIHPGDELRVSGQPRAVAQAPRGGARPQASTPALQPPSTARNGVDRTRPSTPPAAQVQLAAPGDFIWPLDGPVIGRFSRSGPDKLDGVRIAAEFGQPVFAAADGEVIYASDEIPNYGQLVLIRHGGDLTTAYAMNSRLQVQVGQRVRAGDHIADAGQSGPVTRPLLHFEVRRGVTPIDPETVLPARSGGES
ncbi:MAG: LysM peptidoglycan-binding domain-containing protein [Oceanicaulis sp.]